MKILLLFALVVLAGVISINDIFAQSTARPREWVTSGPFQIDRSQYAIGEKIMLVINELNENEKGQIMFMRPLNDTHYSVYITIPFDGMKKDVFNYYVEPQISKFKGINSINDLIGEWRIVFNGTTYSDIIFNIVVNHPETKNNESDISNIEPKCLDNEKLVDGVCKVKTYDDLTVYEKRELLKNNSISAFEKQVSLYLYIDMETSEEEAWEFVGDEKRQVYEQTFKDLKSRGISLDNPSGVQYSKLSAYEKSIVQDAFLNSVELLKYKSATKKTAF